MFFADIFPCLSCRRPLVLSNSREWSGKLIDASRAVMLQFDEFWLSVCLDEYLIQPFSFRLAMNLYRHSWHIKAVPTWSAIHSKKTRLSWALMSAVVVAALSHTLFVTHSMLWHRILARGIPYISDHHQYMSWWDMSIIQMIRWWQPTLRFQSLTITDKRIFFSGYKISFFSPNNLNVWNSLIYSVIMLHKTSSVITVIVLPSTPT